MAGNVFTGALALVKVNGQVVGKMQRVSISENIRRVYIRGLGTTMPSEGAAIEWASTVTCAQYEIDFRESGIPNAIRRDVETNIEFEDNLILDDVGVQIDLFKKVKDAVDPNTGLIRAKLQPYASVTRCLIEGDGVDINEGQVAGRNQTFGALDPVLPGPAATESAP